MLGNKTNITNYYITNEAGSIVGNQAVYQQTIEKQIIHDEGTVEFNMCDMVHK